MAKLNASYFIYRLLYTITLDRKWLLKCIDIINQIHREEVIRFLDSKEV